MRFTLDAYAARSCPVKVHNTFHPGYESPAADSTPAETNPDVKAFKVRVFDEVARRVPGAVDLRPVGGPSHEDQEAAVRAAVESGAPVIISAMLPRDWDGHRASRPDFLVRGPDTPAGNPGYYPAQVKHQQFLQLNHAYSSPISPLWAPDSLREVAGVHVKSVVRAPNLIQLAHYWRHLEALGWSSVGSHVAALVGTDDVPELATVFTWVDLDEQRLSPRLGTSADPTDLVSAMERYDDEHAFRVDIARMAGQQSPDDPPVMLPVVQRECDWCTWWPRCREVLDDDDLSLRIRKSALDPIEIGELRRIGVQTVGHLAEADLEELLPSYLLTVTHRAGTEERLRLAWRRAKLITADIALERVSSGPIALPAADLEVDFDIETSLNDRVYLWGFLITNTRTGDSWTHQIAEFADLDEAAEIDLAVRALTWLRALVEDEDALVFHYSHYEVQRLASLASRSSDPAIAWAQGYARERFVDLFAIMRQHFFGAKGLSLKVVATAAADFSWRDEEPGGLNSQRWFDDAVHNPDETARQASQLRVLEYNEDDVRATWHLRQFLRDLS